MGLDLELPKLYPWQLKFMGIDPQSGLPLAREELLPFNYASCGTKAGKSLGTSIGLAQRFLNERVPCLWTAPFNRQLEPIWRRYFKPVFSQLPRSLVRIQDTWGRWSVELKGTDAALLLLSGEDADALRGATYMYAAIDEAARYTRDAYESVLTNLTDQDGVLWAISTPKKEYMRVYARNWFFSEFLEGRRQNTFPREDRTSTSMQVPTSANPLPAIQKRVELMRRKLGSDSPFFREEYLGELLDLDGSVFRRITELHNSIPGPAQPSHVYVYGWDPALRRDASVISIWDVDELREVWLEQLPMNDWGGQLHRVGSLCREYNISRGRFDATALGGQIAVQDLRDLGIPGDPISFNQNNKSEYVNALARAMDARSAHFINDETAVLEMEKYAFSVLPSGTVRYAGGDSSHDDFVSARYLAWAEVIRGGIQFFIDPLGFLPTSDPAFVSAEGSTFIENMSASPDAWVEGYEGELELLLRQCGVLNQ